MVKFEKGKILSSLMAIALLFGFNNAANASSKIEFSYAKSVKNNDVSSEAASNDPIVNVKNSNSSKKAITKSQSNKITAVSNEVKKPNLAQNNIVKSTKIKTEYVSLAQMNSELGIDNSKSNSANNFVQKSNAPSGIVAWQKIGGPYQVNGIWYIPNIEDDFNEVGNACTYKKEFQGRLTADGEVFDNNVVSVAHTTLPMPGMVEVTNLENNNSIIARVNDRGPYTKNCMFGVSQKAANLLGFNSKTKSKVRVRYVGYAPPPVSKPAQQFAINKLNPSIKQRPDDNQTMFASNEAKPSNSPKTKPDVLQSKLDNSVKVENVNYVKPIKKEKFDYNSILASL